MKMRWILVSLCVLGILIILAAGSGFVLWGIYSKHWESPMIESVARSLPIPVARFAGKPILLRSYLRDVRSFKTYLASDEAKAAGLQREMTDTDRQQVLERLIEEAAISELAGLRDISLTQEEVDEAIQKEFIGEKGNPDDFSQYVQKNFGWSMEDFKDHIARPILLERKLSASYAADHNGDSDALQAYLIERVRKDDVFRYLWW